MHQDVTPTLYAYVDGSDLDGVAEPLIDDLVTFVARTVWKTATPVVVNDRLPPGGTSSSNDLPVWNVGLNLPAPPNSPAVLEDVVAIVQRLVSLRAQFNRDFVIGLHDPTTGIAEDFFFVDSEHVDMEQLRALLA